MQSCLGGHQHRGPWPHGGIYIIRLTEISCIDLPRAFDARHWLAGAALFAAAAGAGAASCDTPKSAMTSATVEKCKMFFGPQENGRGDSPELSQLASARVFTKELTSKTSSTFKAGAQGFTTSKHCIPEMLLL